MKRITAEVAARHGVLLKEDDPALVLVTISETVLEECFERLETRARGLVAELDACFEDIQQRASAHLTDEVRSVAAAVREEIHRDIQAAMVILDAESVVKVANEIGRQKRLTDEQVYELLGCVPSWY